MPSSSEGHPSIVDEEKLLHLFKALDASNNGVLDVQEMQTALRQLGLPASASYMHDLFRQYDHDGDKVINYEEFRRYVNSKEAAVRRAFQRMDRDGSGELDVGEVQQAVAALGLSVTAAEAERMVALLDTDKDGRIGYHEFRRFVVLLPDAQVTQANIVAAWLDSTDWVESMEYRLGHVPPMQPLERLMAGGVAGAVSRTVVAPLERLRTIMMADHSATRLGPVLARMWADGGVRGLYKGNLATVMKVFPASAIQFAVYDSVKDVMLHFSADKGAKDLDSRQKFAAGLIAGATACSATYPLEALRTQISVARGAAGSYLSILRGVVAERGLLGLYQGYSAGLAKDSMTQALGFASYEALCSGVKRYSGEAPSTGTKGVLGGMAALAVMSATMPLENVMRRLQVQGQPGFPLVYTGLLDCASKMLRQEGISAFWRGSLSSFAKVVPSIAATRLLYETIVEVWGIGGVRRYRVGAENG